MCIKNFDKKNKNNNHLNYSANNVDEINIYFKQKHSANLISYWAKWPSVANFTISVKMSYYLWMLLFVIVCIYNGSEQDKWRFSQPAFRQLAKIWLH